MFKFFRILLMSVLVIVSACSEEEQTPQTPKKLEAVFTSPDGSVTRHTYNIEVADTQDKMYRGLMGRTSIDDNYGLLFDINILPKDTDVAFWMKDTLVALDMIFVDDEGKVFFIFGNARPNDTTPIIPSARPRAVLEVKAGQTDIHNIQIGDILKADLLGNK